MNQTMIDLSEATLACPGPSRGSAAGLVTVRLMKAAAVVACGMVVWVAALTAIL